MLIEHGDVPLKADVAVVVSSEALEAVVALMGVTCHMLFHLHGSFITNLSLIVIKLDGRTSS